MLYNAAHMLFASEKMSVQLHMHLVQISIIHAATMSSTSFGVHYLQSGYELATR